MNELISIIIPTYGRPQFLLNALNSILIQENINYEVIIVDDNENSIKSSSNTFDLINHLLDENFIYIKHLKNLKGSAARNTGLAASRGKFICFLDDDDEFLNLKLVTQMNYLKNNYKYDAVYCLNEKYLGGVKIETTKYSKVGDCTFDLLSLRSDIHTSSIMFRRESLIKINGFDESFIRHQEYELLTRFFEFYKIGCIPEVLLRVNIDSAINRPPLKPLINAKLHLFRKLKKHILKFSAEEQKDIYEGHNFHLLRTCIKNLHPYFFIYLFKVRINIKTYNTYFHKYLINYINRLGSIIKR